MQTNKHFKLRQNGRGLMNSITKGLDKFGNTIDKLANTVVKTNDAASKVGSTVSKRVETTTATMNKIKKKQKGGEILTTYNILKKQ